MLLSRAAEFNHGVSAVICSHIDLSYAFLIDGHNRHRYIPSFNSLLTLLVPIPDEEKKLTILLCSA